jgi:predicted alpha/beta-fold hydrolase
MGLLRITGELRELPDVRAIVVIVHGLGGSSGSHYATRAAWAAERAGLSCLRVNLRGADGRGEDLYHAGLTDDLDHILAAPELAHYEAVHLLGYSLGGHVVLRYGSRDPDSRVRAIAAVSPPLDLAVSADAFDKNERWLYRRYVLGSLKEAYATLAARGRAPCPYKQIRGIRYLREWDEATVVPRFGFANADDYYRQASVAKSLGDLHTPALLVTAAGDPMVPAETLRPVLNGSFPALEVCWVDRGGHASFPRDIDLELGLPATGVESQVIGWLEQRAFPAQQSPG